MPKELLEAKKLELIQEKVLPLTWIRLIPISTNLLRRLMLKKQPNKFSGARNKNALGRKISIAFGIESELSEEEVVVEETELIMIMIDALSRTRDPHLHDAVNRHIEMTTMVPDAISWTHISLVAGTGEDIRAVDGHLHLVGLTADLSLLRSRLQSGIGVRT